MEGEARTKGSGRERPKAEKPLVAQVNELGAFDCARSRCGAVTRWKRARGFFHDDVFPRSRALSSFYVVLFSFFSVIAFLSARIPEDAARRARLIVCAESVILSERRARVAMAQASRPASSGYQFLSEDR